MKLTGARALAFLLIEPRRGAQAPVPPDWERRHTAGEPVGHHEQANHNEQDDQDMMGLHGEFLQVVRGWVEF